VIRILLADDQQLVRDGLRMMLDAEPDLEVTAEAADGREAFRLAAERSFDVAVMDVRMPVVDGIEATRMLAERGIATRVLMLTTFDLDEYVYRALRAGASGFMLKDATREQLAAAVRTVARGDALLAPVITKRLIADYCRRPTPDAVAPAVSRLTPREHEVLLAVAAGRSNAEIAATLYLGEATVKSHVAQVLAKLGLRDRVQIVVFAYESGLVRPGVSPVD
jgi:DNA-binding NarL/FixJ family response regulator